MGTFEVNVDSTQYFHLSNDSYFGFKRHGKWWPTATHYLEAKKFEGTHYEEEIRKCSTVLQVKNKTREREYLKYSEEGVNKIKVFGTTLNGCEKVRGWNEKKDSFYEAAIRAKCSYHPSIKYSLVKTYPSKIVSRDPDLSYFLEKLRVEFLTEHASEDTDLKEFAKYKDLKDTVLRFTIKISKMELWREALPEMVEDAIFNLIEGYSEESFILPNTQKYISSIHEEIKDNHKFKSNSQEISEKVGKFIHWISKREYLQESISKSMKRSSLKIPPIRRKYRENAPK